MLLHRHRIIGAALDGRVVGYNHAFATGYPPDPRDDARGMDIAAIEAKSRERRKFKEWRSGMEQEIDALARQHLATRGMPDARRVATAPGHVIEPVAEFCDQGAHDFGIAGKI